MSTKLKLSEQETAIHWDEDSDVVEIYTSSPLVYKRLIKEGLEPVREHSWARGSSWFFELDKKDIRIKPGRTQCKIAGSSERHKK